MAGGHAGRSITPPGDSRHRRTHPPVGRVSVGRLASNSGRSVHRLYLLDGDRHETVRPGYFDGHLLRRAPARSA
jgi:hypothetical protein